MPRDEVPDFNPNPDRDTIPGFRSGVWREGGETGKVLTNDNDPVSIHLHRHPDGLTISKYVNGAPVERYNFNTGRQEKG